MLIARRKFLIGLVAAPAIVRINNLMPVRAWSIPLIWKNGLLVCNGAALRINDFPELFAVLGNTYGGSDNKFNLPDFGPITNIVPSIVPNGNGILPTGMITSLYGGKDG
jgi:hypothetical protein